MPEYSLLTLYKASAGSGKTFQLAVRYIALLAENPTLYRNILAVTFTNKATQEMMQRILSQLYGISHSLESSNSYLTEIQKFLTLKGKKMTADAIRKNAGIALNMLLQDFGHFRIETIDSFFQSILKNMARELQLGGGLNIELDQKKVIAESIESFMGKLKRDDADMKNVERFIEGNMNNDQDWRINSRLESFASQLFQETFLENGQELTELLRKPDSIHEFRKKIDTFRDEKIKPLEERISQIGTTLLSMVPAGQMGKSPMARGIETYFTSLRDLELKDPGVTVSQAMNDSAKFFQSKFQAEYQALGEQMQQLLCEAESIKPDYLELKNSYDLTTLYLYELSLILSIRREIDALNSEKSRFLLADTTNLLTRMQDGDTSFIFERTGSFTDHMMIDEFQDTSRLQWHNLKILMEECLAHRKECLVVGDVKQSIYRWRNGDSNILNTEIDREFANYHPEPWPLAVNRRSRKEVVDFNSEFFRKASDIIDADYYNQFGSHYMELEKAYGETGAKQESVADKAGGYVKVAVNNNSDKTMEEAVAEEVRNLVDAGVRQSDITILFRARSNMRRITEYFNQNLPEYRLISAEAFRYDSSCAVRMIVNALKWITAEDDQLALFQLAYDYSVYVLKEKISIADVIERQPEAILPEDLLQNVSTLRQLPLYELVERLYNILQIEQAEGQDAFIFSFLDALTAYLKTESADAHAFLEYWDEVLFKKTIPSGSSDGIQLITIHQSKGLEFHTVIVPYCSNDWSFTTPGHGKISNIWCKPSDAPFSDMPLVPVAYSKEMNRSVYRDAYRQEYGQTLMDNLNIFYVAFTRATDNLIILGKSAKEASSLTASSLIRNIFQEGVVETGTISPHEDKREKVISPDQVNPFNIKPLGQSVHMKSFGINANFRQSNDSAHFVHEATGNDAGLRQDQFIDQGKLLHELFSRIRTAADIESQVQQMLMDGQLESEKQASEILKIVSKALENPTVADWFSGRYTLFNETSILFRQNGRHKSLRPDRVMRAGDRTIILDYKFTGTERKLQEHKDQVQEYRERLKEMGIENVDCYIWYFYSNKIEQC